MEQQVVVKVSETVRWERAWAKARGQERPLRPSDVAPVERGFGLVITATAEVAS